MKPEEGTQGMRLVSVPTPGAAPTLPRFFLFPDPPLAVFLPVFFRRSARRHADAQSAVFRGREKEQISHRYGELEGGFFLFFSSSFSLALSLFLSLFVSSLLPPVVAAPVPTRRANEVEKIKTATGDH